MTGTSSRWPRREDFIRVANEVAGRDLTPFFDRWLFFKEKDIRKAG